MPDFLKPTIIKIVDHTHMQSIQNEIKESKKRNFSFFLLCQKQRMKTDIRVQTPNWHISPTPRRMSSVDFRTGSLQLLGSQLVISNPGYVLNQKDGMSCTTIIFHFYQSVSALCCDYSQSPKHTLGTCKWFLRNKHSMYESFQEPVLSLSRFDLSQATPLPTQ